MNSVISLNPREVRPFTEKSNLLGLCFIAFNWALIALAFYLPVLLPYWPAYFLSIVLIANRQLGLAILMHDASHYMLMKNKQLNLWLGRLLCGAPVLADLDGYRTYHLEHHKKAGTSDDPDYPNYRSYPVSKQSLARKILRDLSGITGLKMLFSLILMHAGVREYDMVFKSENKTANLPPIKILSNLISALWQPIVMNALLFSVLLVNDQPALYLLWVIAYLTFFQLFSRLRNAAEHANVPDLLDTNPFKHARTTKVSWWERLTFAPNYVNYHVEHHLRPNVPCYRLPSFHEYLKKQGVYKNVKITRGYAEVVSLLIKK